MTDNLLPVIHYGLTKKGIEQLALVTMNAINEGEIAGTKLLQMAEQLKAVEEYTKLMKENKQFLEAVREEVAKYPQGFVSPSGAEIKSMEAGTRYDYSSSPKWAQLKQAVDIATANLKAYEDWMKKIPQGEAWPDPETGEAISAPAKSSTSTYQVKLAK